MCWIFGVHVVSQRWKNFCGVWMKFRVFGKRPVIHGGILFSPMEKPLAASGLHLYVSWNSPEAISIDCVFPCLYWYTMSSWDFFCFIGSINSGPESRVLSRPAVPPLYDVPSWSRKYSPICSDTSWRTGQLIVSYVCAATRRCWGRCACSASSKFPRTPSYCAAYWLTDTPSWTQLRMHSLWVVYCCATQRVALDCDEKPFCIPASLRLPGSAASSAE